MAHNLGLIVPRGPTAHEIFQSPEDLVKVETEPLAGQVVKLFGLLHELEQRVTELERQREECTCNGYYGG